jgi:hypothetical protein
MPASSSSAIGSSVAGFTTVSGIARYSNTAALKAETRNADLDCMSGAGYDPKIIERFVDQLQRKADTVRVGCAVGGGIFGVFVGAVPLTPLKSVWGVPPSFGVATIIVGALLGILIGYVVGEGRAFRYRVQAQSAMFQLEIERRVSSAVAQAVAQVVPARIASADDRADDGTSPPPPPPPSLASVDGPRAGEPLLRPPGAPAPPVSPTSEDPPAPPLSPAAIG